MQLSSPTENLITDIEQTHQNVSYKAVAQGGETNINGAVRFPKLEIGDKRVNVNVETMLVDDGTYEVSGESILYEAIDWKTISAEVMLILANFMHVAEL